MARQIAEGLSFLHDQNVVTQLQSSLGAVRLTSNRFRTSQVYFCPLMSHDSHVVLYCELICKDRLLSVQPVAHADKKHARKSPSLQLDGVTYVRMSGRT